MHKVLRFAKSFYKDGFSFWGLVNPILSFLWSVCKYLDIPLDFVQELSYAWALLPLLIWTLIAYARRWAAYDLFVDAYSHCLSLQNINVEKLEPTGEFRYVMKWKNTIDKPISYEVAEFCVNGNAQEGCLKKGGIISPFEVTSFYTSYITPPLENPAILDVVVEYGAPNKKIRKIVRKCEVTIFNNSVTFIDIENQKDKLL